MSANDFIVLKTSNIFHVLVKLISLQNTFSLRCIYNQCVYMIDMILHSSISFCGIYLERRVDDHFINRLNCQQQILVSFAFISNFLSYTQTSHYTIIVGKPLPLYYCSTFCDCRMWLIWTDFGTLNITSVSRMSTELMVYHNVMQLTAGHQTKYENNICTMLNISR